MKSNKRCVILLADDWQGVYVDGYLEVEGHTAAEFELDVALAFADNHSISREDVYSAWLGADGERWIEDVGRFPVSLDDVPEWVLVTHEGDG